MVPLDVSWFCFCGCFKLCQFVAPRSLELDITLRACKQHPEGVVPLDLKINLESAVGPLDSTWQHFVFIYFSLHTDAGALAVYG